jgi:hypothetical protein
MAVGVICPKCGGEFKDVGTLNYYNLHVYQCTKCGLKKLRCGNTNCDWYVEAKQFPTGEYQYTCSKCKWSGLSGKAPPG